MDGAFHPGNTALQNFHSSTFQEHDWGDSTTAVTGLSDLAFPPGGGHTEEDVSSSGRVGANSRFVHMGKWASYQLFKFLIRSTAASGGTTQTTATLRAALRPTPMSLHGDSGKTDF